MIIEVQAKKLYIVSVHWVVLNHYEDRKVTGIFPVLANNEDEAKLAVFKLDHVRPIEEAVIIHVHETEWQDDGTCDWSFLT